VDDVDDADAETRKYASEGDIVGMLDIEPFGLLKQKRIDTKYKIFAYVMELIANFGLVLENSFQNGGYEEHGTIYDSGNDKNGDVVGPAEEE